MLLLFLQHVFDIFCVFFSILKSILTILPIICYHFVIIFFIDYRHFCINWAGTAMLHISKVQINML